MSWSFPITNPLEESINNQVNSMVGNNDVNLKTIVKMALVEEKCKNLDTGYAAEVLSQMKENNKMEIYFIDQEYSLTYDLAGNLIPVECINERKEGEKDPSGVVLESEGSKQ